MDGDEKNGRAMALKPKRTVVFKAVRKRHQGAGCQASVKATGSTGTSYERSSKADNGDCSEHVNVAVV